MTNDWPCKYCHCNPGKGTHNCPWYEPMTNLEYLEFILEEKQYLSTKSAI